MSRTLYERIYRSEGKAYPKPHPDAEWVNGYWSVPVEPDYEAAAAALEPFGLGSDIARAKRVVDAALRKPEADDGAHWGNTSGKPEADNE